MADLERPELAPYTRLTDAALRRSAAVAGRAESDHGIFLAESSMVVRRALAAGHAPQSFLLSDRYRASFADVLTEHRHVPVFTGPDEILTALTGFHLHRGALAACARPAPRAPAAVIDSARRLLVAEDLVDHSNIGAVIRSAVALGWDGLLLSPRCADPLYRRAIRVSMGTVFTLPTARASVWPGSASEGGPAANEGVAGLRAAGYRVAALEVTPTAVDLDDAAVQPLRHAERLALIVGSEGNGVRPETLAQCDVHVKIPMPTGVDSLNVAAATAVALWELRAR
ncbi:MAG: RNA methyltransferase [Micrococcus sp.]|nr:RNA methyltransferase [Micrococcus sp.]